MKYQQDEKGLFTFYKEQQTFQEQLKKQKIQKKQRNERKEEWNNKTKGMRESSIISRLYPEQKNKVASQPIYKNQQINNEKEAKLKHLGAVIIPNKSAEKKDEPKQKGIFLSNQSMAFQQLQKYKKSVDFILKRRKRLNLKQRYEFRSFSRHDSKEQSIILPGIGRIQQSKTQRELIILPSSRNKLNPYKIKSNSKSLTNGLNTNNKEQVKRYVSYIEYNRDYFNESSMVVNKSLKLSQAQKKIYDILSNHCKLDN